MLPRLQCSYESFLSLFILNPALAFAFRYDKEVVGLLALLNFDLFRLTHHKLNLRYHVVFDLRIESKDQVLLQLLSEDEACDFLLQARTDHFEKFAELVLVVQRLLDVLEVGDDPVLDLLR